MVNGSTTVAEPIREAVTRAVAELGYVPNLAARSLVTQRTDSIALVMPEAATRVFSDDQVFPGIIRGVSQELEAADKQLVLMLAGSPAGHQRVERYTTGRHVDGVLLRLAARRRPAARHAGAGSASRWWSAAGRSATCPCRTSTWTTWAG